MQEGDSPATSRYDQVTSALAGIPSSSSAPPRGTCRWCRRCRRLGQFAGEVRGELRSRPGLAAQPSRRPTSSAGPGRALAAPVAGRDDVRRRRAGLGEEVFVRRRPAASGRWCRRGAVVGKATHEAEKFSCRSMTVGATQFCGTGCGRQDLVLDRVVAGLVDAQTRWSRSSFPGARDQHSTGAGLEMAGGVIAGRNLPVDSITRSTPRSRPDQDARGVPFTGTSVSIGQPQQCDLCRDRHRGGGGRMSCRGRAGGAKVAGSVRGR